MSEHGHIVPFYVCICDISRPVKCSWRGWLILNKKFLFCLCTVTSVRGEACVNTMDSNKEVAENQSRLPGRSSIIKCWTQIKKKRELLHNALLRLFTQVCSREGNKISDWHTTGVDVETPAFTLSLSRLQGFSGLAPQSSSCLLNFQNNFSSLKLKASFSDHSKNNKPIL